MVDCFSDQTLATSPHSAVVLVLRTNSPKDRIRSVIKPRSFPAVRPIGCNRAPEVCDISEATATIREADVNQPLADSAYDFLIKAAELELGGLCDTVLEDGTVDPKYCGRSEPLKKRWTTVVAKGSTAEGAVGNEGAWHSWLGVRLLELGNIMESVSKGAAFTTGKEAQ